ncbi:MAG: hypothetical protein ACJ76F_14100 [Bacteroidia bacterium]
MENKALKIILGIVVGNIAAFIPIFLTKILLSPEENAAGILIFSEFIVLPFLMGIISAFFWRDLELRNVFYLLYAFCTSILGLICSAFFMGEGYICLIIVSPLLIGFVIAGTFIGKVMFKRRNTKINSSVIGTLLVVFAGDIVSNHDYTNMVSDTMVINAPIEKVWQYVVAYEPIREKENYWLFRIGMPSPVQSTVDGYCKGAGRKCIFSNGYTFDEKMTVYNVNKDLTFDIVKQPRDPEIMGHIDILRGQFLLTDNGDGTTTLVGNSWYKLYVFPVWYYDIWAASITRNVHLRVMEHIKLLSEKNV